jgi:effector-binding domain-containing protein
MIIAQTIESETVLYYSEATTLHKMSEFIGSKVKELYIEAQTLNLKTGPLTFIYDGLLTDLKSDRTETEFTLELALPLNQIDIVSEKFGIKTLEPFECISMTYTGEWSGLGKAYENLLKEITKEGYILSGVSREVYIKTDSENPKNNITEIQIGILETE